MKDYMLYKIESQKLDHHQVCQNCGIPGDPTWFGLFHDRKFQWLMSN